MKNSVFLILVQQIALLLDSNTYIRKTNIYFNLDDIFLLELKPL